MKVKDSLWAKAIEVVQVLVPFPDLLLIVQTMTHINHVLVFHINVKAPEESIVIKESMKGIFINFGIDTMNYRSKSRSNSQEDRRGRSDIKAKKRSSRSRSSSKGKRVIFDFEVFLSAHYIRVLTDNNAKTIKRIKDQVRIHQIVFDHDLSIPGLDGSVIKLSDDSYTCKYNALLKILKEIEEYQTPNKKDRHECSITILVPEGMVSLLIGSKGRQINNIMRESRTQIVVNPAIHKMTYRTVNIDGIDKYFEL